ncbi:MAG: hypothetical protein H6718_20835 [Polyangiaceae bacterium]|nr:hypothetical protein [Myxococcales bacterium]MCB9587863.1 hypothetical protein [Polyangiaceae bacterium]MCB9608812.1 hypothetical protein [Polyangiaceae bacterium]
MITLRKSVLASALLLVTACANVLGIEDTEVAASCKPGDYSYDGGNGPGEGTHNAGMGEDFSCVGNQPNNMADTDTVNITLAIVNLVNPSEAIEGISVKACASRSDLKCENVVAEATSDASGLAVLAVPTTSNRGRTGYQGYFEIKGPDAKNRVFLDYLQYFSRPVTRDRLYALFLVRPEDFVSLFPDDAETAGDPNLGAIAMEAVDCPNAEKDPTQQGAPHVRFAIENSCDVMSAQSREFYFSPQVPSTQLSETQGALAIGGFIGIKPANDVVVQAYWRTDAQNLKVVEDRLIVRPGTLTTLRFEPNQ